MPASAAARKAAIERFMAKPELTKKDRDTLRFKLQVHEDEKVHGVEPQTVQEEIEKTTLLFSELEKLLDPEAGPWMFGLDSATALDGNLVLFIVRLRDLGLDKLILESIISYAETAFAKHEWNSVMRGRKTMPGI